MVFPLSMVIFPSVFWKRFTRSGSLNSQSYGPWTPRRMDHSFLLVNLPSGNLTWLWKITIFSGKTHYRWPFSIAMLVYQRVSMKYPFHVPIIKYPSQKGSLASTLFSISSSCPWECPLDGAPGRWRRWWRLLPQRSRKKGLTYGK